MNKYIESLIKINENITNTERMNDAGLCTVIRTNGFCDDMLCDDCPVALLSKYNRPQLEELSKQLDIIELIT